MDSQANAIYDFLTRLDSPDIATRRQASAAAKEALTTNFIAYILQLLIYCRDPAQPKEPRLRAISLLKESIALDPLAEEFDPALREQLQARWKAAPQEDRHEAKYELLSTLAADERDVREVGGRLIASISSFEVPENAWPELLLTLSRAADTEKESNFEAALMTLNYIAQELSSQAAAGNNSSMASALLPSTNIFLNAACKGLSHASPILQLHGVSTIYHSLELIGAHFGEQSQRDFLVGVLCTAAASSSNEMSIFWDDHDHRADAPLDNNHSNSKEDQASAVTLAGAIKEQAMSCLVKIAFLYYEKLGRYKVDLVRLTREAIAVRVDPELRAKFDEDAIKKLAPSAGVGGVSRKVNNNNKDGNTTTTKAPSQSATLDHGNENRDSTSTAVNNNNNNNITNNPIIESADRIALEALQFWATVCTAEKEVREGTSSLSSQGRAPLDFAGMALKPSLGLNGRNASAKSNKQSFGSTLAASGAGGKSVVELLLQGLLLQPETMAIMESERQQQQQQQQKTGSPLGRSTIKLNHQSNTSFSSSSPRILAHKGTSASKLAQASSKALLLLAQASGDKIIEKVMPFVQERVEFRDWHSQEAACMAFGCIIYGPDPMVFREKVSAVVSPLLELIRSMNPVTADTAAWCIALICDQFADVFLAVEGAMDSLLNAVNAMFRRDTSTALRAAQIIHNLSLQFEDEDDPDGKRRRGDVGGGSSGGGMNARGGGGSAFDEFSSSGVGEASMMLGTSGRPGEAGTGGSEDYGTGRGGGASAGSNVFQSPVSQWKESRLLLQNYSIFVDLLRGSIEQEGGALRMEAQEALNALIGAAAPQEKIIITLEEILIELLRKAEEFFTLVRQESYPRQEGEAFISLVVNGLARTIRKLGRWRPITLSKHCTKLLDLTILLLDDLVKGGGGGAGNQAAKNNHSSNGGGGRNAAEDLGKEHSTRGNGSGGVNQPGSSLAVKTEVLQMFGALGGAIGRELLDNILALSGPSSAAHHGAGVGRLQGQLERIFSIIDSALKKGHSNEQLCIAAVAALSDIIPGSGSSFANSHLCMLTLSSFESLLKAEKVSLDIKCSVLGCLGDLCQYTGGQFRAVSSLMDLVLLTVEEKEARNLQRLGGMKIASSSSSGGDLFERGGGGIDPHAFEGAQPQGSNKLLAAQQQQQQQAKKNNAASSSSPTVAGGGDPSSSASLASVAAARHNRSLMEKALSQEHHHQSATACLHYACDLHESICHFLIGIFQGFKGNLDPLQGYVTRTVRLGCKIAKEYSSLVSKDRYAEEPVRAAVTLLGFIANAIAHEDINRLMQWKQDFRQQGEVDKVMTIVAENTVASDSVQEALRFSRDEIDHVVGLE